MHYCSNGNLDYEGEFKNNKYEGNGIYYLYKNYIIYKGQWKEGFPKGYGCLYFNFFNIFKYERNLDKNIVERCFILIKVIMFLFDLLKIFFGFDRRKYILIFILIISIFINI